MTADVATLDGGENLRMLRFGAITIGWMLFLFGLMRSGWMGRMILLPWAALQERVASALTGAPVGAVTVNASCTGGDAMALCLAATLAFPVSWGTRIRGALGGVLLISVLNAARIGTLALVVRDQSLFTLLHIYVWPAILVIAVAAYVGLWMGSVIAPNPWKPAASLPARRLLTHFAPAAVLLTSAYFLVAGDLAHSTLLGSLTAWTASVGGILLGLVGVETTVVGSMLRGAHGSFLVTPECIASPLIPLYVAGAVALQGWRRKLLGLAFAPPLFLALGMARLLVLVVPPAILSSPAMAIHGFNQAAAGVAAILAVAWWSTRSGSGIAAGRSERALRLLGVVLAGLAGGAICGLAAPRSVALLQEFARHGGHMAPDPQGALALLPAFQLALGIALVAAAGIRLDRRATIGGLVALALSSIPFLVLVAEASHHFDLHLHVSLIRGWALGAPVLLVGALSWSRHRGSARPTTRHVALETS